MTALAVSPLQGQNVTYRFRSEMKTGGAMDKIMAFAGKIGGEEGQIRTEYLKGRQLRTDEGTQSSTIVRMDEKRMYFLHHDQRSYVSLPLDSLGAGVAAMAQGMREAEMEPKADGGEQGPSVTFRVEVDRTGENRDMAGYPAEQVFITLEGERVAEGAEGTSAPGEKPASRLVLLMELWMSDQVPGYRELRALQEEYGSQIAPGESGEAMGEALLEMFTKTPGTREALERAGEEMMKLEGMAVRSHTYIVTVPPGDVFRRDRVLNPPDEGGSRTEDVKKMAGNMLGGLFGGGKKEEPPEEEPEEETPVQKTVLTLTEELVEVRTDPLPDDLFQVPGNYTEIRESGETG
jgi:hypothetical protein